MILYAQPSSTDPAFNLAFEQHIFDTVDADTECFLLWRNTPSIVVGKHQNVFAEINSRYVRENNIPVFRRISGGGTVFHDIGNINFTFIKQSKKLMQVDLSLFCHRVAHALKRLGLEAEVTSRNDLSVNGLKFSGNAQHCRRGRILHHGTLLYESALPVLRHALACSRNEVTSNASKSVPSSVTNIRHLLPAEPPIEKFMELLKEAMFPGEEYLEYVPNAADREAIDRKYRETYCSWDWNYGASPVCDIKKERLLPEGSRIGIEMTVRHGLLESLRFSVNAVGGVAATELTRAFVGRRFCYADLAAAIEEHTISTGGGATPGRFPERETLLGLILD